MLTSAPVSSAGFPQSSADLGASAPLAGITLTPEMLGMERTRIIFSGRRLRLFNGRGAISVRDWTVTGLQTLQFPPIDVRDYHFLLAFRDEKSKVLIEDVVGDAHEQLATTGQGTTPLGFNFFAKTPFVMLLQQAYWQPNMYLRTGTFHKVFNGHWISFGLQTKASVSAEKDEIYLEVQIHNRQPTPLVLTVIPVQSAPKLYVSIPGEKTDQEASPDPGRPALGMTSSSVTHPDAFTLASKQIRITVVSDLAQHTSDGWSLTIPAQGKETARFAIILQRPDASPPELYAPDLAQRVERADHALRERLRWASEKLPRISTSDKPLDDLYYRCLLSVLDTRWVRENFTPNPFYAVGTWVFTIAWDTSYASELLAMLDPEGLREGFLNFIRSGLLKSTYIPWNGKAGEFAYAQDPFAKMRILEDYLRQTGDFAFLDRVENGATVYEWMKRMGREIMKEHGRPDGLLDFGSNSNNLLEMRTDGYEHVVAATNGLAVDYFRQVAEWGRARNDPEATQFQQWASQLEKSINDKLWNEQAGWFDSLFPDGSRHAVWSYHVFDVLGSEFLSEAQRRQLIRPLAEGQFLGPNGMYSVSKRDETHWDLMDEDWGGGGQYTGMPLRIAETLYRLGHGELAWNILSRCARWTERYPYIPQDAFTDYPNDLDEEDMPLEIASGSGVQAILFGTFGLRPKMDGELEVSPSYHQELGEAKMTGYLFRGHSYDVVMGPWGFEVYQDGKLAAHHPHGIPVKFPKT
jgi:hypothetical protein